MLGGHTADDARIAQIGTPLLLQGTYFVAQLAQSFVDALGFTAGAGGAQAQAATVQIKVGGGQGRVVQIFKLMVLGLRADPQVDIVLPAQTGLGLQVGG
ncbi:hypothetical protein D3C77_468490 [compost metagenome]